MPFFEKNYANGNLYIDFEVLFPDKINEQKIKELSKVRIIINLSFYLYLKMMT